MQNLGFILVVRKSWTRYYLIDFALSSMVFAESNFEKFLDATSDWLLLHCDRTLCFALILLPSNQCLGLDRNKCILDRCHLGLEVTQLEYWDFAFFISLIIQDCFIGYNCQSVLEFETWNSNVKCELWGLNQDFQKSRCRLKGGM